MDPNDVARIMASVIAKHLEGSGAIKNIFLTDIASKTVMLLQEAVEAQGDLEPVATFQAEQMCTTDPFSFQPPGSIRSARDGTGSGSGGKGGHPKGGHSGGSGGHSGGSGGHSGGSSSYSELSSSGREGIKGKQPKNGKMVTKEYTNFLEGFKCASCIEIIYSFPAGHQEVST